VRKVSVEANGKVQPVDHKRVQAVVRKVTEPVTAHHQSIRPSRAVVRNAKGNHDESEGILNEETRSLAGVNVALHSLEDRVEKIEEAISHSQATDCFEHDTYYAPVNMNGQDKTKETDISACQTRCANTNGCAHFSFWPDGGCHLQDSSATLTTDQLYGGIAGPPACSTPAPTFARTYTDCVVVSSDVCPSGWKCGSTCWQDMMNTTHNNLQAVMTCPGGGIPTTPCMTSAQYDAIVGRFTTIMEDLKHTACINNLCPLADFAGCVLRAAGHDFMDFRDGRGGSDGCLWLDHPDNKGLINCLHGDYNLTGDVDLDTFNNTVYNVYTTWCHKISLADFLVVAAHSVMGFTSSDPNHAISLKAAFRYGRTTSFTCEYAAIMPNPDEGCEANEKTFIAANALHLSWRETAALMGVHTLGKATVQNSGFEGWWVDEHHVHKFNNNFFVKLINNGWGPETVTATGKVQWVRVDEKIDDPNNLHKEMMINTDLCLAFNNTVAANSSCCAWGLFHELKSQWNVFDYFENQSVYCGRPLNATLGYDGDQALCCSGATHDTPQMFTWNNSCPMGGPAWDDIHEFASNETIWLEVFRLTWTKVVEMGFSGLQPLNDTCPATCTVSVYEHWPEGMTANLTGLEEAEAWWKGHAPTDPFQTGDFKVMHGKQNSNVTFNLGSVSNKTSSVKVTGECCKAYNYETPDCSGAHTGQPIDETTQLLSSLPPGVVTPGVLHPLYNLPKIWGCNDCTQCVKVVQCGYTGSCCTN